ncbi:right-handed parallel beta-helix repeat-containing protein [Paenibacillus sp. S28]|uniref:right-handed parallel beta-helix repeat-containing protein n=1 Tax=Paenibacillus sp. S28 TaxID=2767463 RepID=UPI001909D01A|nr:right-handed parallel beta-helix repeat-containing protein [Paenibacillus sp. S28]
MMSGGENGDPSKPLSASFADPSLGAGINVRLFGAKGDGVTDDTPAIQLAISSISQTGGTILIPDGVYKANITIRTSNIYITGTGTLNGCINLYGTPTTNDRFTGTGNVKIDGITILGDKVRNGINIRWYYGVLITNVRFIQCLKAIYFEKVNKTQHSSRYTITSNQLIDCNYGLYVDYSPPDDGGNHVVGDVNFSNNMYESRTNVRGAFGNMYHIWAKGIDGLICKGNTFFFGHTGMEKSNIYIENFNWVVIEGNHLFEAVDSAVIARDGFNLVVANNNVAWAQKYGIFLSAIVGGVINGNNLTWKSGEDIASTGVYIENSPYFIGNISNNNLFFPGIYAIQIKDSSFINITGNNARSQYGKNQPLLINSPATCTSVSVTSNQFTNYPQGTLNQGYYSDTPVGTNYLSGNTEGLPAVPLKGVLSEEYRAFTNNETAVDLSNLTLAVFACSKPTVVTQLTKENLSQSLPRMIVIYSYTGNLRISRQIPGVKLKGSGSYVSFPADSSMTLLVYGSQIMEISRNF